VAWSERKTGREEAREIDSRRDRSMIQSFLEDEIGVSLEALGLDDNAGTDTDGETAVRVRRERRATEHGGPRRAEGDDD